METLVRNGKTAKKMYDAFNQGDIPYIIYCLHKDVIWEVMGQPEIPHAGIYHGPADVKIFFKKINNKLDYTKFLLKQILENTILGISTVYEKAKQGKPGNFFSIIGPRIL